MQDLRLVGVHEDGEHLLLAAEDGSRFRLPLDDALRAAARRDRPRLGQLQIEIDGGLRPREVQALIRSGLSTQEVADRAGWTVPKVQKYEGPVLAERTHVAAQARAVRLRHRGSGASAPTLGDRVAERLAGRGVAAEVVVWDSWREPDGEWVVCVTFPAGGRQRQAVWSFDAATRLVQPRDDEARWLGEDEPAAVDTVLPPDVPVYDIEADGGLTGAAQPPAARRRGPEPVDLMAAMRERSGARSRRGGRRRLEPVALPLEGEAGESETDAVPTGAAAPAASATDGGDGAARQADDVPDRDSTGDATDRDPTGDATDRVTPDASTDTAATDQAAAGELSPDDATGDRATDRDATDEDPTGPDAMATATDAAGPDPTDESAQDSTDGSAQDSTDGSAQDSTDGSAQDSTDESAQDELVVPQSGRHRHTGSAFRAPDRQGGGKRRPRTPVPSWDDIVFGTRRDEGG